MENNFIERLMKLLTVLLVLHLILIVFNDNFPKKVSASITGEVIQQKEAVITNGVIQEEIHLKNHLGNQRLSMLSIDLNSKDLSIIAGVPYKNYPGLETVTGIANRYSTPDDVVVGAINADFYNTSTGEVSGLFIHNGEILNLGSRPAFGITSKGKAIIGYPEDDETGTNTTLKEPWDDVVEAVGGNVILVQDGQKTDEALNHLDGPVAPRTAVGIKDDGSVFFLVNDGRNPGYSEGMDLNELADLMLEMGAIQAINLDGGGSSTLVARQPGDADLSLVNLPSDGLDGTERSVANALLIRSSAPAGELSSIAIQPNGRLVLANSETSFKGIGLDAAHNPVEINDSIAWSLSNDIGTVTDNGVFIAGKDAGKSDIIASYGSAEGSVQIEVVDQPDRIQLPQQSLIIKRDGTFNLAAKVYHENREVTLNQHLLNWEIEGDIGTVDDNGIFTAQNKTGEGSITVSYGDISDQISIEVGKQPVIIEDFENGIDHWEVSGASYKSVNISQTTYPDPARFGKHALKIDYDFTDMPGTSGVYAHTKDQYVIDGYPEALGMWVYGDGNEHWLRAQLRDGEGNAIAIDFVDRLDWEGWKYIEAPIPSGRTLPLKLDLAVRYMEISADKKDKGTIYIDNIRTVYGETTDDLTHPTITDISPKDGSIISGDITEISATTEDDLEGTGINSESIEMYINNELVPTSFNTETGKVTFSSKKALKIGTHSVQLLVQDNYGNLTERSWEFSIEDPTVGADKVSDLLSALPKKGHVKLKHKEAIEAGRLAYDELTDDQQKLVSDDAIERLINAELELSALEDVDFSELDELLLEYAETSQGNYTDESWAALESALTAAGVLFTKEDVTQTEVDEAYDTLLDAIENLEEKEAPKPKVNKDELKNLLGEIEAYDPADYTEASFEDLSTAINNSSAVLSNDEATQDDVDAALEALQEAIEGLVEVEIDFSVLDELFLEYAETPQGNYTDESWAALQSALTAAEVLFTKEDVAQAEVDEAYDTLLDAVENLEEKEPIIPTDPEPKTIEVEFGKEYDANKNDTVSIQGEGANTTITMPDNLPEDTKVIVTDARNQAEALLDGNLVIAGDVFDISIFGPDNEKVHGPFTLTMSYDKDQYSTDEVDIYYYDEDASEWIKQTGMVDDAAGTITVEVDHFSIYGVLSTQKDEKDDKDSDNGIEIEPEDKDSDKDSQGDGDKLPKTSTNTFNIMLIGSIMLLLGSIAFFIYRYRNRLVQNS